MTWKNDMSAQEVAELIDRYLEKRSLYPQEWNDFVDTPQSNKEIEMYRRRCHQLGSSG